MYVYIYIYIYTYIYDSATPNLPTDMVPTQTFREIPYGPENATP